MQGNAKGNLKCMCVPLDIKSVGVCPDLLTRAFRREREEVRRCATLAERVQELSGRLEVQWNRRSSRVNEVSKIQ